MSTEPDCAARAGGMRAGGVRAGGVFVANAMTHVAMPRNSWAIIRALYVSD